MQRTALITGATSGIGLAYAKYFASLHYDLVITGTRNELNNVSQEIHREYAVTVFPIVKKIESLGDIEDLIKTISGKDIQVLVNNAGYGLKGLFFERPLNDYLEMINLHIILSLRLIKHIFPTMEKNNEGLIINVSSDAAYLPIPGNAVYSGTKAFIKQFTECLYLDIRKKDLKIKTIVVCPGLTRTNFHEKIHIPKEKQQNKGIIRWSTPENVVKKSMKDIEKGRAISITGGFSTSLQIFLYRILPKRVFYNIVLKMFD